MNRIAVFPGSFDPITKGHESIVRRSAILFDEIVVAIGENIDKQYMFSLEKRKHWLEETFSDLNNIKIADYKGLTVDFCKSINANFIIRGLRSTKDFNYEQSVALMNKTLAPNIETILLFTDPMYSMISSTSVRDIIKNNGNVDQFLPSCVKIA